MNLFFGCGTQAILHWWLLEVAESFSFKSARIGVTASLDCSSSTRRPKVQSQKSRSKIHKYLIEPHVKASAYPASPPNVTGRSMRASRCCGRPVLQFHGAGSTIARAQPPPKHMHCRHYRPTTVPNTSQNGRPTHQSGPNSSTLSLQGVVFKVEGTKVTLCHRRQSSPYRNFPELSLSSTSVLNCTWQYCKNWI
jgi:hypothetical protein